MKKRGKRVFASALALVLAVSGVGDPHIAQAAKAGISATKSMTLEVQQSKKIKVKGSNIKKKSFKSSNGKVAVVNKKGKVTAKKTGNCKIVVTVKYKKNKKAKKLSTKKLTCKVRVTQKGGSDNGNGPAAPGSTLVPGNPAAPVTSLNPGQPGASTAPGTSTVPGVSTVPGDSMAPGITASPSLEPAPSVEPGEEDWAFNLKSIAYDGTEYQVEQDRSGANHFMMELYGQDSLRYLLPELEKATFKADYQDKEVNDIRISKIKWHNSSYYEDNDRCTGYYTFTFTGTCDGKLLERTIYLSDFDENIYAESLEARKTGGMYDGSVFHGTYQYVVELADGESLKDKFQKLSSDYTVYVIYKNKKTETTTIEDLTWHDEPYYSHSTEKGYYSFTAGIKTAEGKEIKHSFYLTEVYHAADEIEPSSKPVYEVKGVARTADDQLLSNRNLRVYPDGATDSWDYIDSTQTDDEGAYTVELSSGVYRIGFYQGERINYANNIITVGTTGVTQDIKFDSLYSISGKVLDSNGAVIKTGEIAFYDGQYRYYCDINSQTGEYFGDLPEGDYSIYYNSILLKDQLLVKDKSMTHDIPLNDVCRVSGTFFLNKGETREYQSLYFVDKATEESMYAAANDEGVYSVYLKTNTTYECSAYLFGNQISLGTLKTEQKDISKDFTANMYEVSGIARYDDGKRAGQQETIYLSDEERVYITELESNGSYSCYVPNGDYKVEAGSFRTLLDTEISVKDKSVTAHLKIPYYHVSGTVTN